MIFTRLDTSSIEDAIRSTIEFYRGKGGEFEWKVYGHDTPSDIRERLLAHGLVPEDVESVLGLDLDSVPSGFWEPSSVGVERLTDVRQLADVARIEDEVFAEDSFDIVTVLGNEMQETPEGISVYVAYADGVPASSAWIRFHPGKQFAELYGGGTIPSQRGKGLYTALVRARAQEARQRGARFLVVDTSPMSRPILEQRGFRVPDNGTGVRDGFRREANREATVNGHSHQLEEMAMATFKRTDEHYVSGSMTLPQEYYTSDYVFGREVERIFKGYWYCAGHQSRIREAWAVLPAERVSREPDRGARQARKCARLL